MGKSANYYNVDDFNKYKKAQGKCVPPRNNILAAACHIQALFDAKKFTYGFIGGLPMLCLGYRREMPDLHIAYDDKDFERLKNKLGSNYRCVPLVERLDQVLIMQRSVTIRHESASAVQDTRMDRSRVQRLRVYH